MVGLSSFIRLFIDPKGIKSKTDSKNGNISDGIDICNKINNEIPWVDRLPFTNIAPTTNLTHTKIESYNDQCDMSNIMSKAISFMEDRQPNYSNPI